MQPASTTILHLCPRVAWDKAQRRGGYEDDSLRTEGFIHCSTPEQIISTANRYYRGQQGMVALVIDTDRLTPPVRYEDTAGRGTLFPHVYGALNREAVVGVRELTPRTDGTFDAASLGDLSGNTRTIDEP